MQCNAFHERVNELLDQRVCIDSDRELSLHANSCDSCERALRTYGLVFAALAPQESPCAPNFNVAKAPASQTKDSTQTAGWRSRRNWFAVAATMTIALGLLAFSRANLSSNPQALAKLNQGTPSNALISHASPSPPSRLSVASGNLVHPIIGLHLVTQADWSGLQPVEMPFGVSVPQVETEWIQVVADEMVPVTQSMNNTLDLILRSLST